MWSVCRIDLGAQVHRSQTPTWTTSLPSTEPVLCTVTVTLKSSLIPMVELESSRFELYKMEVNSERL